MYFVPYLYRGRSPLYHYNTKCTSLPRVFGTPSSHSNFNSNSKANFKNAPHNCKPKNCKVHCNFRFAILGLQLFRLNTVLVGLKGNKFEHALGLRPCEFNLNSEKISHQISAQLYISTSVRKITSYLLGGLSSQTPY